MNKRRVYTIFAIVLLAGIYAVDYYLELKDKAVLQEVAETPKEGTNLSFLPTSTTGTVIHHNGYSLSYAEDYEQAEWVAYELKKSHLSNSNFKRPYFEIDKAVSTGAAHWENYKRSGYTRGHLCPAADRKYSKAAHDETFLTSNISPQTYEFNSGIWNRLEQKIRYWAGRYDGVYVVTGGVLKPGLRHIGKEEVAVPEQFYKVILDYDNGNPKMLGFLVPHSNSDKPLHDFAVSVDEIEALTGIDFFPGLEDNIENKLEAQKNTSSWVF